jgi:transcription antitermination factor NusG
MIEIAQNDSRPGLNPGLTPSEARWYAVHTAPRHEKKVAMELAGKAIDCFLPTVSTVKQWSDRKRVVEEPLFAGYLFARFVAASSERIALLRSNGVVGLVGTRGIGTPIPEDEIQAIQLVLESRVAFAAHPYLNVGQRVRVRGGALDGLEGILQSVNGDKSLVVSVELIQRAVSLTISGYMVEPVLKSTATISAQSSAQG